MGLARWGWRRLRDWAQRHCRVGDPDGRRARTDRADGRNTAGDLTRSERRAEGMAPQRRAWCALPSHPQTTRAVRAGGRCDGRGGDIDASAVGTGLLTVCPRPRRLTLGSEKAMPEPQRPRGEAQPRSSSFAVDAMRIVRRATQPTRHRRGSAKAPWPRGKGLPNADVGRSRTGAPARAIARFGNSSLFGY